MASRKKPAEGKKRNRRKFMDLFKARIEALDEWIQKTSPKFASAPKSDVADGLQVVSETLVTIAEALPKLNGWAPPAGSTKFVVGDSVTFKKDRAAKLVKEGAFTADELDGEHEIVAVVGRRVKLERLGLFQNLFVTKSV